MVSKLEITGQQKCTFEKFGQKVNEPLSNAEWAQKLQTFSCLPEIGILITLLLFFPVFN